MNINEYLIEEIESPFLILHSKDDPMAKYENMKRMISRLKKATFIEYENGGHVLFGHGNGNRDIINKFIRQNSW